MTAPGRTAIVATPDTTREGGRQALVALELRAEEPRRRHTPDARFVAHLIAAAAQAPQTRTRFRTGAAEGADEYRAAQRPGASAPSCGRRMSRSV